MRMFILNNIHGRDHNKLYGKNPDQSPAIFDITEKQISSAINSEWNEMQPGDLVCVIGNSYKMSTVYQIRSIEEVGKDEEHGKIILVRGDVVAKFANESGYSETLNKHNVQHKRLKNNMFSIGFNVANLKSQMDSAEINTRFNASTIGEL